MEDLVPDKHRLLLLQVFINSVGDVAEDIRAMAVADIGALLAQDAELLQQKFLLHLTNGLSDQVCTQAALRCW